MPSKKRTLHQAVGIVLAVALSGPVKAAKIDITDEAFLELHGFMQTWLRTQFDPPQDQPELVTDFYLRRLRLFFSGQLNKKFRFFVGTLDLDFGKDGDYTSRTRIGDAWMEIAFSEAFKVNTGLLKLPFSRHGQQGGGKLHGLDFHGAYLKRKINAPPHRDVGIMVRGLLLNQSLDYRLSLVDGQEPGGEHDAPRIVGRIGYNVLDAEPTFFWAGTYLGKKKILSFGFSFDLQPDTGGQAGDELSYALALDALADIPFGDNGLVATLNAYLYGPGQAVPEGSGFWADVGYRFKTIEPLIAVEWYEPKAGDTGKRLAVLGGLNWWMSGHNANIKIQFGVSQLNNQDQWIKELIIQAHLFY